MTNVMGLNASALSCIGNNKNIIEKDNKTTKKSFMDRIQNSIDLYEKRENTPVMDSETLNKISLNINLSPEQIEQYNSSGRLPDGFKLAFTPKIIEVDPYGNRTGLCEPPRYRLVNENNFLSKLSDVHETKRSDQIPEGFKLMNNSKGETYIVPIDQTLESLDKDTTTFWGKIKDMLFS